MTIQAQIKRELWKELCRRDVWEYAKAIDPNFFKESRPHLKKLLTTLQRLYQGSLLNEDNEPYKRLIISMPPRFGKSYSLNIFCQFVLGNSSEERIITASYNEKIASRFSKGVRNGIAQVEYRKDRLSFLEIFDKRIKQGEASAQIWALEGQDINYLGCGFGGTITGIGGTIGIIDDPIKDALEAFNDRVKEEHHDFYKNTFLQRFEGDDFCLIVNHTRWSKDDLAGRIIQEEKKDWYVLEMPAMDKDGNLLCEEILSLKKFNKLQSTIDEIIFKAVYLQETIDEEGLLYRQGFEEYDYLPSFDEIITYVDTADTGKDYLCALFFGIYNRKAYIIDWIYTQEDMSFTETLLANKLFQLKVNRARIESNNGGMQFTRSVKKTYEELCINANIGTFTWFDPFHQKHNKQSRIFTNSHPCQQNILFPKGWKDKDPVLARALLNYSRKGKNTHDDAPDTLTGVSEFLQSSQNFYVG